MGTVSVSRREFCKLPSEWGTVPNYDANAVKEEWNKQPPPPLPPLSLWQDVLREVIHCRLERKQTGWMSDLHTLIGSYQTWCVLLTVVLFAALMADYVWVTGMCYNVWSVATWCHNSNKYTKTPMTPLSLTSLQWTAVSMYLCQCWWRTCTSASI